MNTEQMAIGHIEGNLMHSDRRKIYIALEQTNFIWDVEETKEFDLMWRNGKKLKEIAKYFQRTLLEVHLLMLDRLSKGKIDAR
ncbi:helix-turn-helix domain containing protein [Bacillus sp. 03113]|uniref:helix-turn-helix domain containing protein n=1 Tax=Bacillus sp. 03113 TaxID=2578211 RepID=UPI0011413565|nr:helix-turn-helix domain containing protein [Bacillus sp. 03113]